MSLYFNYKSDYEAKLLSGTKNHLGLTFYIKQCLILMLICMIGNSLCVTMMLSLVAAQELDPFEALVSTIPGTPGN